MAALEYYKLQEQPFGVTPDSRYLYLTQTHKEALNSVIYGIESGCGFVALIATPGLGKTTLLFQTLEILRDKARIVFLFQTISTPLDLLRALLSGLGVRELRGNLVEMQVMLKDLLAEQYRAGKRVVLVIDEAQNLDDSVLELVRMLSNFETARDKLIQIVLAGQPQLAENIGSPELLQLRQRVSIFARLKPFSAEETSQYISHRLRIAGYASDMPLFTKDALALIALCSDGIPRNINNLCFNALSLGAALRQRPIDRDIIRQVVADLDIGPLRKKLSPPSQPERVDPRCPNVFHCKQFICVCRVAPQSRRRHSSPLGHGRRPFRGSSMAGSSRSAADDSSGLRAQNRNSADNCPTADGYGLRATTSSILRHSATDHLHAGVRCGPRTPGTRAVRARGSSSGYTKGYARGPSCHPNLSFTQCRPNSPLDRFCRRGSCGTWANPARYLRRKVWNLYRGTLTPDS